MRDAHHCGAGPRCQPSVNTEGPSHSSSGSSSDIYLGIIINTSINAVINIIGVHSNTTSGIANNSILTTSCIAVTSRGNIDINTATTPKKGQSGD